MDKGRESAALTGSSWQQQAATGSNWQHQTTLALRVAAVPLEWAIGSDNALMVLSKALPVPYRHLSRHAGAASSASVCIKYTSECSWYLASYGGMMAGREGTESIAECDPREIAVIRRLKEAEDGNLLRVL